MRLCNWQCRFKINLNVVQLVLNFATLSEMPDASVYSPHFYRAPWSHLSHLCGCDVEVYSHFPWGNQRWNLFLALLLMLSFCNIESCERSSARRKATDHLLKQNAGHTITHVPQSRRCLPQLVCPVRHTEAVVALYGAPKKINGPCPACLQL